MKRVFLLEQDETLAAGCKEVLEGEGNLVRWSAKSEEALSLLSKDAYDLVIYDIAIESIDISRLFHLTRMKNRRTEFLIITPEPWSASLEKTFCFRVRDYLVNPFHLEELKVKVNRILHSSIHLLSPESGQILISCGNSGVFCPTDASGLSGDDPGGGEHEGRSGSRLSEWISMTRSENRSESHFAASLDLFLAFVGEWFDAARGSILLRDETGDGFYMAGGRGVPRLLVGERVKLPEGAVSASVAGTKKPLLIEEFREAEKYRSSKSSYSYGTSMSCPLMDGDDMIGMIHLSEPRDGMPFTRSGLEQFAAFSDTMVLALKEYARSLTKARQE